MTFPVPIFQFTPIPFWRQNPVPGMPLDGEPLTEAEIAWWITLIVLYPRTATEPARREL